MIDYYKIADLIVKLDCTGRTYRQAQQYKYPQNDPIEDISICIPRERYENFSKKFKNCTVDQAEYMLSGLHFYRKLLNFNGMFLHACAIEYNGKAYLFSGDSGTGKSTHASIWKRVFGDSVNLINEDKPALRYIDGTFFVYGTPWSGTGESRNVRVPLGGICFLKQATENGIYPLSVVEAMQEITIQTTHYNLSSEQWKKLSSMMDLLLSSHKIYKMECNMSDDAAKICYAALSDKGE